MRWFHKRGRAEHGVAAIEMAAVLPLLVLLALGVVESAWAFSQQQAVRAMAREGARVAATHELDTPGISALICDAVDIEGTATLEATGADPSPGAYERGALAFFEVRVDYTPLTGFIPAFNNVELVETVWFVTELRKEDTMNGIHPIWWDSGGGGAIC